MKNIYLLILTFFFSIHIFAQNTQEGVVYGKDNEPLSQVLVILKDTEFFTTTNESGSFSIPFTSTEQIIIFQKSDYNTIEMHVSNAPLKITLAPKVLDIFELSLEDLMQIEVVTASKKSETTQIAPANITVITADQIEKRGYRNLFELLNDLPSMTSTSQLGEMFVGTPSVRGLFQTKRLKLMINGLAIDPREGSGTGWTDRFPIEAVERVEFIAGPYATTYGRNTFSGVINVILKQPTNSVNAIASVLYGSYNQTQASAAVMGKNDNWDMFVSVFHNQSREGVDLAKEYPEYYSIAARTNSLFYGDSVHIAPNISSEFVLPWVHTDIFFEAKHSSGFGIDISTNFSEYSKVAPQFTPLFYAADKEAVINDDLINTRIFFNKNFTDKLYSSSSIYFQKYDWWGKNFYLNGTTRQYTRDNVAYMMTQNFQYNASEVSSFMLEASYEKVELHPFFASTTPIAKLGDLQETSFFNLSLQNETSLFQDKLKFVLGVMYEYSTAYDQVFIPRFSVVYNLNKTTFKALYGAGYLSPGSIVQADQLVGFIKGTTDIAPEYVNSFDLNISQNVKNKLKIDLSFFYNDVKDIIQLVKVDGLEPPFTKMYKNIGTKQTYGADVSLYFQPISILDGFMSYSYLDGQYDAVLDNSETETIKRLPTATTHQLKTGVNLRLMKGNFNLYVHNLWVGDRIVWYETRYNSTGQQINVQPFDTPDFILKGYDLVDVTLSSTQKLFKNTIFSIGIKNLFDTEGFDPVYDVSNITVFPPIRKRYWNMQIKYTF